MCFVELHIALHHDHKKNHHMTTGVDNIGCFIPAQDFPSKSRAILSVLVAIYLGRMKDTFGLQIMRMLS